MTPVLRGVAFAPAVRAVSPRVEDSFGFAEATLVSFADLFAGKMVAALDRQHPRDLFDVRDLLATEGLTRPLVEAFLVYLLSHGRPMAEILAPTRKDLSEAYARTFAGMTETPVALAELLQAREDLITGIHAALTETDQRFLLGGQDRRAGLAPDRLARGRRPAGRAVEAGQPRAPGAGAPAGACRAPSGGAWAMISRAFSDLPIGKFSPPPLPYPAHAGSRP